MRSACNGLQGLPVIWPHCPPAPSSCAPCCSSHPHPLDSVLRTSLPGTPSACRGLSPRVTRSTLSHLSSLGSSLHSEGTPSPLPGFLIPLPCTLSFFSTVLITFQHTGYFTYLLFIVYLPLFNSKLCEGRDLCLFVPWWTANTQTAPGMLPNDL